MKKKKMTNIPRHLHTGQPLLLLSKPYKQCL